jgi:hypothetical protein
MTQSMKMTDFLDIAPYNLVELERHFITLMMEAVCTSESLSNLMRLHSAISQKAAIVRY